MMCLAYITLSWIMRVAKVNFWSCAFSVGKAEKKTPHFKLFIFGVLFWWRSYSVSTIQSMTDLPCLRSISYTVVGQSLFREGI